MNDRARLMAVSLFPSLLSTILFFGVSPRLQAQPAEAGDTPAPQRTEQRFRFQERPAAPESSSTGTAARTPATSQSGAASQPRTSTAQRPANDPMRFAPAPPPVPRAENGGSEPAAEPERKPAATAPPQRAAADPMRFAPAPTPKPVEPPPSTRPVAAAQNREKEKAAPAPARAAPDMRFELRSPEAASAGEETFPGPDEEITLDEKPKFNAAELVRNVHYPEDAIRDGIQGRVLVRVLINRKGAVLRRIVEYSNNHALDTAAVNAVAATRFTPAKLKGVPTAAWITVPVNFVLTPEATEPRR